MFQHDFLTWFLSALLLLLLCSDGYVRRAVSYLWRYQSYEVIVEGIRRALGYGAAILILLFYQNYIAVCGIAFVVVCLGGRQSFSPSVGVPALVVYALCPVDPVAVCVLPVLFGRLRGKVSDAHGVVSLLLGIGLLQYCALAHTGWWFLDSIGVFTVLAVMRSAGGWREILRNSSFLRSFLLLGVYSVARHEGVEESASAALFALLLDVTLQVSGILGKRYALVRSCCPPFPGFLVMWTGMHAVFGIAAAVPGWTLVGIFLSLLLTGLSVAETAFLFPYVRQECLKFDMVSITAILPILVNGVMVWNGAYHIQMNKWQVLYLFSGGNGGILALPILCGMIVIGWGVFGGKKRNILSSLGVNFRIREDYYDDVVSISYFLEKKERILFYIKQLCYDITVDISHFSLRNYTMGIVFWLFFLGIILSLWGMRL